VVRITKIEIKNFRAFPRTYQIDLHKAGKNLLVYGENGSGKSSLYLALKLFLESSDDDSIRFETDRNIFIKDDGHIKVHLRANPGAKECTYEWSQTVKETSDPLIINASKSKGFLDYKALLETHYLHLESDTVNVFDLMVETLLANVINNVTRRGLNEEWKDISEVFSLLVESDPSQNTTQQIASLEEQLEVFNTGLTQRLAELQTLASKILRKFGYNVALNFDFEAITYNSDDNTLDNQQILLTVQFFDQELPEHHRFLNEAKLSAIALAIYFAGVLLQPDSDLKILALDDVLIGLDMSNRLPVLDILNEYFSDHQVFLTTYDKAWYEIVKQRTQDNQWKYAEFYFAETDEYELPVYVDDKTYLEQAQEYLSANDYKACAIYLRTAFETIIKDYCGAERLLVRYRRNPDSLNSQDFWDAIKSDTSLLEQSIIDEIELYRSIILNPLSHATIANIHRREIEEAIEAVEKLQNTLNP
jgi:energy-coupling factor transporter ATP-binding protein EcfA2